MQGNGKEIEVLRIYNEKTVAARRENGSKLTSRQKKPGMSSVDIVDQYDQAPEEGEFTGLEVSEVGKG